MELKTIRNQIDVIDENLVALFVERMTLSAHVAEYKKANHLPIYVPAREEEILNTISQKAGSDMASYARELYIKIFELSRKYQSECNLPNG